MPELPVGIVDNRRMVQLLKACVLSFFDKHLKGKDDRLLDSPYFPEISTFLSK